MEYPSGLMSWLTAPKTCQVMFKRASCIVCHNLVTSEYEYASEVYHIIYFMTRSS